MRADASAVLADLRSRRPITIPVLLLAAHPDDETLALGGLMPLFQNLTLIHATDGEGGGNPAERLRELDCALAQLGVAPMRRQRLSLPDGQLATSADRLVLQLEAALDGVDIVVTHAFEGGHSDHDVCALAASIAIARKFPEAGLAPAVLEFGIYRKGTAGLAMLDFPDGTGIFPLSEHEATRKQRALAQFTSQSHVVSKFSCKREALRQAQPVILAPRPAEELLFTRGDEVLETVWRDRAQSALSRLPPR